MAEEKVFYKTCTYTPVNPNTQKQNDSREAYHTGKFHEMTVPKWYDQCSQCKYWCGTRVLYQYRSEFNVCMYCEENEN